MLARFSNFQRLSVASTVLSAIALDDFPQKQFSLVEWKANMFSLAMPTEATPNSPLNRKSFRVLHLVFDNLQLY